jgi:hypothetical protein
MSALAPVIPADIRLITKEVLCNLADEREKSKATHSLFWSGDIAFNLVARAVLAERERCRLIALSEGAKYLPGGPVDVKGICRAIARNINPHLPSGASACAADTADGVSPPSPSADQSRADGMEVA